ncbi:MAG: GNAT family N-acetyltransferase [Ardenticatenales bacterium]|nr:GNAT family N-acetyltransferase [Ardenticatenales bacterium]MCB9171452.1 GNAT family N-acetyltransferase [Ardenticatenales bacterium]
MSELLFETERLIGRRMAADDAAAMHAVYGDVDAMAFVGDGAALSLEECEGWIDITHRNYERRGYGMSTIIERATGEIVGFCGLVHPEGQIDAELKYAYRRTAWGRGYATEAARAMIDYGHRIHGLDYIIATIKSTHEASRSVLLKAGMRYSHRYPDEDGTLIELLAWRAEEAKS